MSRVIVSRPEGPKGGMGCPDAVHTDWTFGAGPFDARTALSPEVKA